MLFHPIPSRRQWQTALAGVCAIAIAASPALALDQVHIALVGEIKRRCALYGVGATVDLGDIRTSGHRDLALRVSCNTPFQVDVHSANGGLRHAGGVTRIGQFTDLLPYWVDVTVPTDTGHAVFACASDAMANGAAGCAPADSGRGIALGQTAALTLSWQSPPLPMIAGRFEDALTISFSPKP